VSAPFFYTPEILRYDFGPGHPLKPERLRRTVELLGRFDAAIDDPGQLDAQDLLRVHTGEYIDAVRSISASGPDSESFRFGFGSSDNPAFEGMYEASCAYVSATAAAARHVTGGNPLAFAIGGGLHHAMPARASGFCVFDDPAIACHILLERFERVAYVDIDVHHGDGVQSIFYNEPRVLTYSIHESGRTLFPGTGFIDETGFDRTSLNVPIEAGTTGDVWLDAFRRTVPRAIKSFQPGAIVLQMGTDAHGLDPLGHIRVSQQHWLAAVMEVKSLGLPIVALGGGGYNLSTVPRMWTSAVLSLSGVSYDDRLPENLAKKWDVERFSDPEIQVTVGAESAARTLNQLDESFFS
jgi:acetoin utilization protein AcuC